MFAIEPPLTSVPLAERGKADHGLEPVHDLLVHQRGGVTAAAEIGALDRGEKIADRAGEVARAHVPGPEARMDVAHRIGHDRLGDLAIDRGERLGLRRQRGVEKSPHVRRHLPPDRPVAHVAEIGDRVFEDRRAIRPALRSNRPDRAFRRRGRDRLPDRRCARAFMRRRTEPTASSATAPSPPRPSRLRSLRRAASSGSVRPCREACRE